MNKEYKIVTEKIDGYTRNNIKDKNNNIIMSEWYDAVFHTLNKDFFIVINKKKYNVFDAYKKQILFTKWYKHIDYIGGLFSVKFDNFNNWFYLIDKNETLLSNGYSKISRFENGYAKTETHDLNGNVVSNNFIDMEGNEQVDFEANGFTKFVVIGYLKDTIIIKTDIGVNIIKYGNFNNLLSDVWFDNYNIVLNKNNQHILKFIREIKKDNKSIKMCSYYDNDGFLYDGKSFDNDKHIFTGGELYVKYE